MKVTVTLLSNKKSLLFNLFSRFKSAAQIITKNVILIIILSCILMLTALVSKFIKIPKEVLSFATNLPLNKYEKKDIKDLITMSGICNPKNYYLAKRETPKEEKKVDETKEGKLKLLDKPAEDKKEKQVFANKNIYMEVTQNTDELQRISLANMKILNYSSKREINFKDLVHDDVILTKASDSILIYNTHTSESYANSEKYQFEYSGIRRSRDAKYNMLAVANEFKDNLSSKGFKVTHNTTPHDYGTYDSSYSRSRITAKDELAKNPEVGIMIDLHRDAIEDLDFRPAVNINGVDVAQCMFVIGVGYDDESNPYYEDNLRLALKIQYIADEIYPGLFRPMIIRNSVYNQDLNKYSVLIEVGASGNTFDEAFFATRCLANLFNIIYKD